VGCLHCFHLSCVPAMLFAVDLPLASLSNTVDLWLCAITWIASTHKRKSRHTNETATFVSNCLSIVFPAHQVDRDEVRLRRTIGRNKDEYHLDRRHIK